MKNNSDDFKEFLANNKNTLWNYFLNSFKEIKDLDNMNYIKDELQLQLDFFSAKNFLSTGEFIYFVNEEDEILNKAINLLK